jgi:integrase
MTARTITVARSLEETERFGLTLKEPKTARGRRTFEIDHDLMAVLLKEYEKHQRIAAGVPDGVAVDLSLVRLRKAKRLGFPRLRLHDLRGSPETILLDKGIPVHVVAARCGHDPAVLLRTDAKRTKKGGHGGGGHCRIV